jgi:hypothetical protein
MFAKAAGTVPAFKEPPMMVPVMVVQLAVARMTALAVSVHTVELNRRPCMRSYSFVWAASGRSWFRRVFRSAISSDFTITQLAFDPLPGR